MRVKSSAPQAAKRAFPLELKSIDANETRGTFSGYGSVFGVVDSYGEVVRKGALKASLHKVKASGRKVPLLWQHRMDEPVGVYDVIDEDDHGLYVEGRLLVDDVRRASEAYALLKAGAVDGLSIGYYVQGEEFDRATKTKHLTQIDLVEVSLVTAPACAEARVGHVKADDALEVVRRAFREGSLPSLRDLEQLLRDAGASKSQATAITNRGLVHLHRGEPEAEATVKAAPKPDPREIASRELASVVRGFSLPSF